MSRQTLLFALLFLVALAAWQLGDIEGTGKLIAASGLN